MTASIAALSPVAIKKSIEIVDNGTYKVTFPGAPQSTVQVHQPTDTELLLYAGSTEHGIWPSILEKACGEIARRSLLTRWRYALARRDLKPLFPARIIQENAPYAGLELFGEVIACSHSSMSSDSFERTIRNHVRAGNQPAVLGRLRHHKGPCREEITPHHAYAVTGYQTTSKSLKLYNPWGVAVPELRLQGIRTVGQGFSLPIEEAYHSFSDLILVEIPSWALIDEK